jgi:O-methyltransferase involved in polyketide biosynthesis
MYLTAAEVSALLTELAARAAPGSRLAVNFGAPPASGNAGDRWRQRALRTVGRTIGEPHLFLLAADDAGPFVQNTGWSAGRAERLLDLAPILLGRTSLKTGGINPQASAVAAKKDYE